MEKGELVAEIIILGAGLTGLCAAYHLEQNNFFDYQIFEKNERPGGLLQSVIANGFTFDHTGHLLHISDPYFKNFLNELADLDENFLHVHRKSAIFSHETLTDYPFQMNLYGLPIPVIAECLEGFIGRKKSLQNPKNFYDWVLKHFGHGIGKNFFFPYNSKLLAYDLKKIHPSWTGRFVPSTTFEALIQGAIKQKSPEGIGYNSSFYYPKTGGIEFIIKRLTSRLTNTIHNNHAVVHIDAQKKIVTFENGRQERFTKLISTLPLKHMLQLLKQPSSSVVTRGALKLECNSVINLNLGFSQKVACDKHWIYTPEDHFPFYRLGFWHNVCPNSVPSGASAAYVEASYLPETTTSYQREVLTTACRNKALSFLNLSPNDVIHEKILTLNYAYVIYNVWREKNLSALLQALEGLHIYSVGRFGAWKYSSMQEAVLDGKNIAEHIVKTSKMSPTYKKNDYSEVSNLPYVTNKEKKKHYHTS